MRKEWLVVLWLGVVLLGCASAPSAPTAPPAADGLVLVKVMASW